MSDTPPEPAGIVPPWMSKDWLVMRARLIATATHATAAAESSTTEDVRKHLGAASVALMDADFVLRRIERYTDHTNGSQA